MASQSRVQLKSFRSFSRVLCFQKTLHPAPFRYYRLLLVGLPYKILLFLTKYLWCSRPVSSPCPKPRRQFFEAPPQALPKLLCTAASRRYWPCRDQRSPGSFVLFYSGKCSSSIYLGFPACSGLLKAFLKVL